MIRLCMTPVSWLSKTRVNGVFAFASTVVGSKPLEEAPTGAVTVTVSPEPPELPAVGEAPDDGPTVGATDAAWLGATDADAAGLPDALDGIGVADGAGAYVQPGGALAEQAAMAAVAARRARAIVRRRIFSRTSGNTLGWWWHRTPRRAPV
jgi:hypothetical protein